MENNNSTTKIIFTIIIVIGAAILVNNILGPEENWGITYDDLGRTVTSFIVMGLAGLLLWLMWKKKKQTPQ